MSRPSAWCLVSIALACAAAAPAWAQPIDGSKVEFKTERVAEGVWMLAGGGGNVGVYTGPEGVFMVDDASAPLAVKLRAAVAAITDQPIRLALCTHHHDDHTGNNEALAAAGTVLISQDEARRHLARDEDSELWGGVTPAVPARALPLVTFSDTLTLHLNGHAVVCFHVPHAHTDGDAVVWVPDLDVIQTGDLLFNGAYPVIDYPAGGSIDGMIAAADLLLARSDAGARFIPGHGALARREDVTRYRDMLIAVRERVKRLVAQGMTLEQIVAARPLADLDATWGQGFVKQPMMLKQAYGTLGRRSPATGVAR